jgi:hypothetical protein
MRGFSGGFKFRRRRPWETSTVGPVDSTRIEVDTPPRSPQCETELEETETFFGNFRGPVLRCRFVVKNEMSYHREAVRVEKLAGVLVEEER